MKKWLVLLMAIVMSSYILAQVEEETVTKKKGTPDSFYLFYELGTGTIGGYDLLTSQGGLAYEYNQNIMLSAYMVIHAENAPMFSPYKYNFVGHGIQIGKVFRKKRLKMIPSVGFEFGHVDIGEGRIIHSWIGSEYASYRTENAYLFPVCLLVHYKLGKFAGLSGRFGYAYNWEYPLVELNIGLCVGKM